MIGEVVPIMDTRLHVLQDISSKVMKCGSLDEAREVFIKETESRKIQFVASTAKFLENFSDTDNVITVFKWLLNDDILYSGRLSREKTFTNFTILQPSAKVFSTKCSLIPSNPRKFSPPKVSRYTVELTFSSLLKLAEDTLLDITADIHPHPFYVCPINRRVSIVSTVMKCALNQYLIKCTKI